jgi:hypothetical protein
MLAAEGGFPESARSVVFISSSNAVIAALTAGLTVKLGASVLEVQRTYLLANDKIAQVAINTQPASRFRHSMTMRRVQS